MITHKMKTIQRKFCRIGTYDVKRYMMIKDIYYMTELMAWHIFIKIQKVNEIE